MDDPNNQFTYDEVEKAIATLLMRSPTYTERGDRS